MINDPLSTPPDAGEILADIAPLMTEDASRYRPALNDLAAELREASRELAVTLPDALKTPLITLVRAMNCYYSNLIEGHHTHPIDIERALQRDFSDQPEKRDLQLEAVAHIAVQTWVDAGNPVGNPLTRDALRDLHARFCENMPSSLLHVEGPDGVSHPIVPGAFRDGYVQVGSHIPPSPGAVPRLLDDMARLYGAQTSRLGAVIAAACAHHRLVFVHPFSDLNGRVARMVSHAMLREAAASEGLWSVARGLARNEAEYKRRLMAADQRRHGGADGRGTLSEARLAEFAEFFLRVSIDQARFMTDLVRPKDLRGRIVTWTQKQMAAKHLPLHADRLMTHVLIDGQIDRAAVPALLGVGDRQARQITKSLIDLGALTARTHRAPLVLAFPAGLASDWMPGLFPDKTD